MIYEDRYLISDTSSACLLSDGRGTAGRYAEHPPAKHCVYCLDYGTG